MNAVKTGMLLAGPMALHPATENRVAALRALAQEMGQETRMAPQPGFVSP